MLVLVVINIYASVCTCGSAVALAVVCVEVCSDH